MRWQKEYDEQFPYQTEISALLYLAINTRLDLSYPVGILAGHCVSMNFKVCQAVVRVLTYLRYTPQLGIEYSGDKLNIHAFYDSDWVGDVESRKSTTGCVLFAAGGPIAWLSKLQWPHLRNPNIWRCSMPFRNAYGSRGDRWNWVGSWWIHHTTNGQQERNLFIK